MVVVLVQRIKTNGSVFVDSTKLGIMGVVVD
jgi:hypothetical protein